MIHGKQPGRWNFRLLWLGETTSGLGNSLATLILPLIATLTLQSSVFEVSLVAASAWVPWIFLGLPVGAWVDRLPLRPIMIACDLISALLFASVPLVWWLGFLSLPYLLMVSLLAGAASVFFSTAYHVYIPSLLTEQQLLSGNAKLQGAGSVAQVAGPGLAGPLAKLVGTVPSLLFNAATFLVSALCLSLIRGKAVDREPQESEPGSLLQQIQKGVKFVVRDRSLRPLVIYGALGNVMLMGYEAIQVPYLVRTLGASSVTVGLLVGCASIGGVLGSLLVTPVTKRFGTVRGLFVFLLGTVPFGLLIPLAGTGWQIVLFGFGVLIPVAGVVASNIILNAFRQTYCPPRLLGRVVSGTMFINLGALPVGAVLRGVLGSVVGLRPTMWIMMTGLIAVGAVLFFSPVRGTRDLPTKPRETPIVDGPNAVESASQ